MTGVGEEREALEKAKVAMIWERRKDERAPLKAKQL